MRKYIKLLINVRFCTFCTTKLKQLAPVVQKVDNYFHQITRYPVDSIVCFANTYLLDSNLSSG